MSAKYPSLIACSYVSSFNEKACKFSSQLSHISVFSGDILMLWVAARHALCVPSVLPHRVLEKHVLKGRLSKINSFNGFIKDIL